VRPAAAVPALAALALLAGCEAHISVDLTDGPTDGVQDVVLDITHVALLTAGGDIVRLSLDDPGPVDLLAFRNGETLRLVQERPIAPERFVGVALDFAAGGSFATLDDGSEVAIDTPTSRTFADIDLTVDDWESERLLVDLNLRFSLVDTGTGSYDLVPVVRAVRPDVAGTVTGFVSTAIVESVACLDGRPAGTGVAVYAFEGGGATPADYVGQDGLIAADDVEFDTALGQWRYQLHFLPAGDYTLALTCQADDDDPASDDAVAFEASADVTVLGAATVTVNLP
jgi:hypothetical protein